jgi:hypothetical protein
MNLESLKINKITSSTWWALNKVLKWQICIRTFFSPWKELTFMTIDKPSDHYNLKTKRP